MTTDERTFREAAEVLTDEVKRAERRRMSGSELGLTYVRRFPELRGKISLGRLLDEHADRLTVVDRAGGDWVWGLNEDEDDDAPSIDIDALRREAPALSPAPDTAPEDARLQCVRFVNYRVLADVTINIGALTVLVGPNGAGKSSILDGLFRGSLLTGRKPLAVFHRHNGFHRVHRRAGADGIELRFAGTQNYMFHFRSGPLQQLTPRFDAQAGGDVVKDLKSLLRTPLQRAFGGGSLLRLDARRLARPSYSEQLEPYLRNDGFYLPSVLAVALAEDPERMERILDGVREVIPAVKQLRAPRTEIRSRSRNEVIIGHRLEVKFGDTGWTPADQLSEGTLLTIGLHTLLTRSTPPRLVLLDDVDRGLHPAAQRRLIEQLSKLADVKGGSLQIVCSTHSPYVLDPLQADAVRVVRTGPDGFTCVSPLTNHSAWEEWKQDMNAGEFWQFVGDEWLEAS